MAEKRKFVRVVFQDKNQRDVPLSAYGFDRKGSLIATQSVGENGVDLSEFAKADRVLLGPSQLKGSGREKVTASKLRRAGALDIGQAAEAITISPELGLRWYLCFCTVTGRVVKPVTYEGNTIEYPVCDARVHVCEIDRWPWIIELLPDIAIRAIRADLLGLEPVLVHWPPRPDPPPEELIELPMKHAEHEEVAPAVSTSSAARALPIAQTADNRAALRAAGDALPAQTRAALASESLSVVRRTLVQSVDWLRDYVIYWPWFWYTCDDLGTVTTDHNGEFSLSFLYNCYDHPDIYVWVEFFIGGVWQTVYAPPRATNTYWNYACGTDITVRITDPRVPYCGSAPPIPGRKVIITTIGNGVNASTIQRASAGADQGLTADGRPFGGQLEPRVDFGTGLQVPTNATPPQFFYRWSYRRAGTSGTPVVLDEPVYRRYRVELASGDVEYRSLRLGPVPGMPTTMFMVPPMDPFDADSVVPAQWVTLNSRDDVTSAFFFSDQLDGGNPLTAAGNYELIFELFDAAGTLITDWGAANVQGRLVSPTIAAPFPPVTLTTVVVTGVSSLSPWFENDVRSGGVSRGMRVTLHIDNNPCTASIDTLTGTGLAADPLCGFYVYSGASPTVNIGFIARHPNNFATFNLDTYRGASIHLPSASANGRVGSAVAGWTYASGPSRYTSGPPPLTVNTLLTENQPASQTTPCAKAAFAETLHVAAMATDGWSVLTYLDAYGIPKAFALSDV